MCRVEKGAALLFICLSAHMVLSSGHGPTPILSLGKLKERVDQHSCTGAHSYFLRAFFVSFFVVLLLLLLLLLLS